MHRWRWWISTGTARTGWRRSSAGWPWRPTSGVPTSGGRIVEEVTSRFGGVDLAHLNAGVTTGEADIAALTDDAYRRVLGVNVDGVVFGVRALVPALSARRRGAIVVTASLAGLIGFSPDPLYCLTKHALVGLVRALAPQLAERGVTVNAVCPGIVDTPLVGAARPLLEEAGFPLVDPAAVAEAVVGALVGEPSGQAIVVQAGREPVAFRFGRRPGPSGASALRTPSPRTTRHERTGQAYGSARRRRTRGQTTRPTPTKSPSVRTPVIQTDAPV